MLTIEEVNSLVKYEAETGLFHWVFPQRGRRSDVAGSVKLDGYRRICLNRKIYYAHRLAWFISVGSWPVDQLDHINGNRDDNRMCNLRDCKGAENLMNQKTPKSNTSGIKGVSWVEVRKKWMASIQINRKTKFFGYFKTKEEAELVIKEFRAKLHGEFTNHG